MADDKTDGQEVLPSFEEHVNSLKEKLRDIIARELTNIDTLPGDQLEIGYAALSELTVELILAGCNTQDARMLSLRKVVMTIRGGCALKPCATTAKICGATNYNRFVVSSVKLAMMKTLYKHISNPCTLIKSISTINCSCTKKPSCLIEVPTLTSPSKLKQLRHLRKL